jgi:hypothetical protein
VGEVESCGFEKGSPLVHQQGGFFEVGQVKS